MVVAKIKYVFVFIASIWVAASPGLWWFNLKERYDVEMPLQFMIQDVLMSILALSLLIFLFQNDRKVPISIGIAAVILAASHFIFVNAFPDGLFMNAATICFL